MLDSSSFCMLPVDHSHWRGNDLSGEFEIEPDTGERLAETGPVNLTLVDDALDLRDQFVPGAEREIVVQVFVTVNIDLGREFPMTGSGYEEVDVRRPVAMPSHRLQQLLGLAARRTGVAARHDRTEAVAAVLVGLDPATEVVGCLRWIEMRIVSHRICVPHIDDGAGNRVAGSIANLTFHKQCFAVVGAIV